MQHARDYDYRNATPGAPKSPHSENDVHHAVNKDPAAEQIEEIAVSGANSGEVYIVSINDIDVEAEAPSNAVDDLVNELTEQINAEPLVSGYVEAEADTSNDVVTVTEREGAGEFTIAEVQDASGHLSISQVQAHAEADPVPFGRAVLKNGFEDTERLVKLPKAGDLTARDLQVTLDGSTDGDYRLTIEYNGGQVFTATYTASTVNADTILQGLRDDINNNGPDVLTASHDGTPSPSELHIVAETAGFADFRIVEADGPSQMNASVATAGDDIRDELDGISQRSDTMERTGQSDAEYPGKDVINVMSEGQIVVETEDSATADAQLWVRLADNGTLNEHGAFRHTFNSGAVPVPTNMLKSERKLEANKVVAEIHQ
ncbi:MAG: hypothetical protein ABEN55_00535 [Bradymonadaceae bacterium]